MKFSSLKDFPFKEACGKVLCVFLLALTFSPALAEILFIPALLFWLAWKIRARAFQPLPDPVLYRPLLIFLGLCVLSAIFSEYPLLSFRGILKIGKHVLIFWMICEVMAEDRYLKFFENLFFVWSFVLALDGFAQYFWGRDLIRRFAAQDASSGIRISASFKTYGLFASYLICTLPYLLSLGLRYRNSEKRWDRWHLGFVCIAALSTLLFLTRSRGAILGLLISTVFLLVLRRKFLWLTLVGICIGLFVRVAPLSMILHINYEHQEQSLVERYYLWDRALQVIQAKPWLGTGINTYTVAHPKYDRTRNWRVQNYYAHNGFLQMAAETGIPAALAFIYFLGAYIWRAWRRLKEMENSQRGMALGLICGALSFILFAFVDTVLHNPSSVMVFWYILGLAYAYQETYKISGR